ncbi:MAG TPA: ATP-binding protein [Acidimicrobiia bacterium]|jgi:signal transduction histidine kinase|nr:ATP-binding protein [Acidimicrobiia bacterium]
MEATRYVVAQTLVRVATWVGGIAGLGLLIVAAVTSRGDLLAVGIGASLVGVIGLVQHLRGANSPTPVLVAASLTCGVLSPFTETSAHLAILPALTLFVFVAILSLPKPAARLYALWCGLVTAVAVPFIIPGAAPADYVAVSVMLGAVGVAGWRFVTVGSDLLVREEESHRVLFQDSPVALLEEDFTAVARRLEMLRGEGVTDLDAHLREHPELLRDMISTIRLRRANQTALDMIGAGSVAELDEGFRTAVRTESELATFREQVKAVWEDRTEAAADLQGTTLDGTLMHAVLHWSAPRDDRGRDLSRVMVAISDVTPRVEMEQRLARALEVNRRLLDFEHALAQCSRSLLLGSGEAALEEALTTLREAIGADRAYLVVNQEDPEQGECFRVVRSVSRPQYAVDDWVGRVIPWSKYHGVREVHLAGRPFQHVAGPEVAGWSRSILSVPIFSEGRWAGCVGFMDMNRSEPWTVEAVRMLEVAAPMLGTFWEREVTRQRLEELVMSKDRFVASVSHELRTPLAAVLGFAEELKASASTFRADELADMLELIADQSQEMADMVEDLLVSARADIGTVSIRAQEVYLRSQAEAVLAGLGSTGSKEVSVVGGRGRVWADPSRTRQIIRNLITNAIRYGGDHVVIEAVECDEMTVLTVTDDGPGLDRAHWEEIFEPYQRAHDAGTQPASIGLGLTVARQLSRLMDGDLVYRCDQEGSVFSLTLPAHAPAPLGDAEPEDQNSLAGVAGN